LAAFALILSSVQPSAEIRLLTKALKTNARKIGLSQAILFNYHATCQIAVEVEEGYIAFVHSEAGDL
jgi:hypothetical protein